MTTFGVQKQREMLLPKVQWASNSLNISECQSESMITQGGESWPKVYGKYFMLFPGLQLLQQQPANKCTKTGNHEKRALCPL